jgi:HKD family nuclease
VLAFYPAFDRPIAIRGEFHKCPRLGRGNARYIIRFRNGIASNGYQPKRLALRVETVTTNDGTLLSAVRSTLDGAEDVFLCVAFVHEKGLRLLQSELERLRRRKVRARLLVTTTFQTTTPAALSMAASLGMDVRILNPGAGRTFHPKLYLGDAGNDASAVIGSANLTGGLFANLEVAAALRGQRSDPPIARAWEWAIRLWDDPRVQPWSQEVIAPHEESFDSDLYAELKAEVSRDPVFRTLGRNRPNRLVELTPVDVQIETQRSRQRTGGAESVPAWMFNLAWDRLRTHGTLSNAELLKDLRVHRSTAVCAILARLPQVDVVPGRTVVLRWQ